MDWKSLVFEDDKSACQPTSTSAQMPSVAIPALEPPQSVLGSWVGGAPIDPQIYQGLVARTSFDSCPNVSKLLTLAGQLEQFIPDKSLRMKAAAAQAASQGVTGEAIRQEIQSLFARLTNENTTVAGQIDKTRQQGDERMNDLTREIAQKQSEVQMWTNKRNELAQKLRDFDAAYTRRHSEIEQLQNQLSEIK